MKPQQIEKMLKNGGLHAESVERLVDSYARMRKYYGQGRYDDVGNHVGNFCENMANIVLSELGAGVEPSSKLEVLLQKIDKNDNNTAVEDTIRLTIPRFLRAAYDLRSKRDTVHVNLEVPVNHVDQSVAVRQCSWMLAELIRVYGSPQNMTEARKIVENLATYISPDIEEYDGNRLVLSNELNGAQEILLHLHNDSGEVSIDDLEEWIPGMDANHIRSNLRSMEKQRKVFYNENSAKITSTGAQEAKKILEKMSDIDVR